MVMTTFTTEDTKSVYNAYAIADQLERDIKDFFPIPDEICIKAIAMLRMQSDEITALRSQLNELL
jgi:hypothetical protein